ncbi:hypothetical protein [Clostridium aciditolerans]|uniref:Uncharacterized protein n=1 Tax=Clostridium aciditolerans TaxID=339861 RepID=A0A934HYD1_9CLOT|nr:hypothetical protein [Clostridium aciditolerans]MBI6875598.1 hypothetical protein [Clostridium aciditolerans]
MIKGFIVNKSKINVKPIAVIASSESDDGTFKNELLGFIGKVLYLLRLI